MTTETETRTFAGLPIKGEIIRGEKREAQRPLEELTPLVQAVLSDLNVGKFGWNQYTPYFNDGEPCVFGSYGIWADPAEISDEESEAYWDEYGYREQVEYDTRWGEYEYTGYGQPRIYTTKPGYAETREKLFALSDAIESGAFDDVLLEAFGDHASITVTRGGIKVDTYEHD